MADKAPESSAGEGRFATTHWSVVLAAGHNSTPAAQEALERLCRAYWYPLYAYVRRRGYNAEDAQDLTQEFFARLLAKHWLAGVDRAKGKFRSFLLAAMNHFLANEWDRARAAKRGGGKPLLSLDDDTAENRYRLEPVTAQTPETLFEQRWAMTVLDQALGRLREESVAAGKGRLFDTLKIFLSGETGDSDYAALARSLQMSPNAVGIAVHRLRQRYRELVRDEVVHTVASPDEVQDELRHLGAVLSL